MLRGLDGDLLGKIITGCNEINTAKSLGFQSTQL